MDWGASLNSSGGGREEIAMAAPPDVAAVEGGGVPGHDRLVPSVETEAAQQALLRDIDAILARLQVGIADERVKMDDLLRRIKAKAS
jgi:hypothetical protein